MRPLSSRQNPPSLRQGPPKDRSAIFAALIVIGLLLAFFGGWTVNAMLNPSQREGSNISLEDSTPAESGSNATAMPAGTGSSKPVVSEKKSKSLTLSGELTGGETGERSGSASLNSASLNSASLNSVGTREPKQKPRKGPPKLTDLDSYKNSPTRDRVKSTWPKKKRSGAAALNASRSSAVQDPAGIDQTAKPGETVKPPVTKEKTVNPSNQFSIPRSTSDIIFYQELIVDRNQAFVMEGITEIKQKSKYRVVSRMLIHPGEINGFRRVSQTVVSANLLATDSKSKKALVESLKNLVGKEFQFSLDHKQKVVAFKGEKEKPKTIELKDLLASGGFTGEGFMVSSVMDLDGWREMAQLSFLLPDDQRKRWTDQMEHDWGQLGTWVGETKFEKTGETNGLMRIDYAHQMRYQPGGKKGAKLPFTIEEMAFESSEAGGQIWFDREKNRIDRLIERFQVSGNLAVSLLGSSVKLKVREIQTFELELHDQSPQ